MVDSSVPLFQFQVGNLEERIPCKLFWRCRFQPFPVSVNLGWSIAVPQKNRRGMAYHSHSDMMFDVWLKQSCLGHYMLINTYKHIRAHLWRGFRLVHPMYWKPRPTIRFDVGYRRMCWRLSVGMPVLARHVNMWLGHICVSTHLWFYLLKCWDNSYFMLFQCEQ